MFSFERTVSALVYCLVRQRCPPEAREGMFLENETTRFVLAQHARMPDYLKLPILLATLALDVHARLVTLAPLHRLSYERRVQRIDAWRCSRLGPFRDLIKFYESLSVYGWYSAWDEATHG